MTIAVYRPLAAAMLLLAPAFATNAAQMFTPPLPAPPGSSVQCVIVNATNGNREITSEVRDSAGNVVAGPYTDAAAWSGKMTGMSYPTPGGTVGVYCHFKVQGSADGYRGAIEVIGRDAAGNTVVTATLPAS